MGSAITYQNLKLYIGDVIVTIQELVIEQTVDAHGRLAAEAILDTAGRQQILHNDEKIFALYYGGESAAQSLFHGIITQLQIEACGEYYYLRMRGETYSCLTDITPVNRLFQDIGMTSHALAAKVMAGYPNMRSLLRIPDTAIGEIVLQYQETDWEFLRRFSSRYGGSMFADAGPSMGIAVGFGGQGAQPDWSKEPYELYYLAATTDRNETALRVIRSHQILPFGGRVKIRGADMYIGSVRRYLTDGLLNSEYTLYYPDGLTAFRQYNSRMTGVSVNAQITGVKRNQVQVLSDIEGAESGNRYWFPFSTVAASGDGSGWYCMPEEGEQVRIFFPVRDEKEGYVITNIQGHNPGTPDEADPMSNPDTKNIIASNKGVSFTKDGIVLSADGGSGQIRLSQDGAVYLEADEALELAAAESIHIQAENELEIISQTEIRIISDSGVNITIAEENIDIDADKIHLNPPD